MEKIIVEKVTRDETVDLRLECLKMAAQMIDPRVIMARMQAGERATTLLENCANDLLRYVLTGTMAEQERARFKPVEVTVGTEPTSNPLL